MRGFFPPCWKWWWLFYDISKFWIKAVYQYYLVLSYAKKYYFTAGVLGHWVAMNMLFFIPWSDLNIEAITLMMIWVVLTSFGCKSLTKMQTNFLCPYTLQKSVKLCKNMTRYGLTLTPMGYTNIEYIDFICLTLRPPEKGGNIKIGPSTMVSKYDLFFYPK